MVIAFGINLLGNYYAYNTRQTSGNESFWGNTKTKAEYATLQAGTLTKHLGYPVAAQFLELSLMSQADREFTIKEMGGEILTPKQTQEKFKEIGLENKRSLKAENRNLQTYVFPANSKVSKKLSSNKMLQEMVNEWAELNLSSKAMANFKTADCGDTDLYLALGQAKVLGLKRTDDGYVEGYIEDVYDFDSNYGKAQNQDTSLKGKLKNYGIDAINGMAVDLQNKGMLKNYRTLIPFRIKL